MTVSTGPDREQLPGQGLDALRGGSFAHPDHHGPVADDGDVTALDRGRLVGEGVVAVEERELCAAEHRVEVVDDAGVDRLPLARGLGHRVDREAPVDPRRVVPLEQMVRQRTQQEVVLTQVVHEQARLAQLVAHVGLEHPADEQVGE